MVGQSFIKDPYHGPAMAESNVCTSMLKRLRYMFKDVCGYVQNKSHFKELEFLLCLQGSDRQGIATQ